MKLKALKRHPYGGKYRNPGDTYEAPDKHAKALILCRQAEEYKAPVRKRRASRKTDEPAQEVDNKAMTAERSPGYLTRQMISDAD